MRREASIPLFLWVATAALAHLLWSGGAEQGARLIDERLDIGRFAAGIRSHVRGSIAPPLEIAIDDPSTEEDETKPEEPNEDEEPDEVDDKDEAPTPEELAKAKDEAAPPDAKAKAEEKLKKEEPEPEPKKEELKKEELEKEELKKEEPKKEELKPAEPKPVEPPKEIQQLELPKKIAVKQHVEDEHQKDNPDAAYISDKANRVAEETRARITSTDQDDKKPTPGKAATGPADEPGNSEETHVRQDNDVKGEKDRSPGGSESEKAERATAAAPVEQLGKAGAAAPGAVGGQNKSVPTPSEHAAQNKDQAARAASKETPESPEVVASESGSFSVSGPKAATPEQRARKAKKRLPPRRPRSLMEAMGLGAAGRTVGGVALNLTPNMAAEAIGSDELSRLRRADGERRKSQHRGSWRTPGLERYRSAIENYVATVKPGNQTALNTAAVPFANYLNQIHARIHPIFADQFLASLDSLPASHPMNDPNLVTSLEIVVEREEGRLVRRGVTKTSGSTPFDISAIDSVERAGPFGTPPPEIVSPDGNVYLHWEFRRDAMACSTLYAHPFILNVPPKPAPLPGGTPLPPFKGPDDEKPEQGERHGLLTAPPATTPDG
jgi:hypothetical protein